MVLGRPKDRVLGECALMLAFSEFWQAPCSNLDRLLALVRAGLAGCPPIHYWNRGAWLSTSTGLQADIAKPETLNDSAQPGHQRSCKISDCKDARKGNIAKHGIQSMPIVLLICSYLI